MKKIEYYHKNSECVAYKKVISSEGSWYESTYDENGNELTFKDSNGYWSERTYDKNGNVLTYKDSDGYWYERTYDEDGNELTYKGSNDYYMINGEEVTKEEFEKFQNKSCPKPKTYTRDEIITISSNMYRYGGGFMTALSECVYQADHENLMKLQSVFEDDFEKYLNF